MDLNGAAIFVRVVRLGSFAKAAQELGLPASTVSDRVSDLEKALGVSLLARTTRKLRLTDAGTLFFKNAELAVNALMDAGEEASRFQKHPTGVLKITAPVDLDFTPICDAVLEYLARFPEVRVDLLLTDRIVDLIGEGFDIAIRASQIRSASLTAKPLGNGGLILVASAAYLQKLAPIAHPGDLAHHKCLAISSEQDAGGPLVWSLSSSEGEKAKVEPQARISSNSLAAIKHLVLMGEGVALLPPTLVHKDIAEGRLIHVLPGWSMGLSPSYLVYTAHRNASPKVKEMIPLLEPRIRDIVK